MANYKLVNEQAVVNSNKYVKKIIIGLIVILIGVVTNISVAVYKDRYETYSSNMENGIQFSNSALSLTMQSIEPELMQHGYSRAMLTNLPEPYYLGDNTYEYVWDEQSILFVVLRFDEHGNLIGHRGCYHESGCFDKN